MGVKGSHAEVRPENDARSRRPVGGVQLSREAIVVPNRIDDLQTCPDLTDGRSDLVELKVGTLQVTRENHCDLGLNAGLDEPIGARTVAE